MSVTVRLCPKYRSYGPNFEYKDHEGVQWMTFQFVRKNRILIEFGLYDYSDGMKEIGNSKSLCTKVDGLCQSD